MTNKTIAKNKQIANEKIALENELEQANNVFDTSNYTKGLYRKAQHQLLDTQYEHHVAQQKFDSLNSETNGVLQANIRKATFY